LQYNLFSCPIAQVGFTGLHDLDAELSCIDEFDIQNSTIEYAYYNAVDFS